MLPCGSEQVLSLAWALEQIAKFDRDDAIRATREICGISSAEWEPCVDDRTWYIGDPRWYDRARIESLWNDRFSRPTRVWLDEDAWHQPLWRLWLTTPKMVLAANLNYLMEAGGRGTVAQLAEFAGRNRTTASKWGRWTEEGPNVRVPPTTAMPRILEFFELRPTCDLSQEPLFLRCSEIHEAVLRIQGKHYLDCLSGDHLTQAVDRLREESARQAAKKMQVRDLIKV